MHIGLSSVWHGLLTGRIICAKITKKGGDNMTETTKTIFEKYEVRKTKKQKSAFREYITSLCNDWGYSCKIEKGSLGSKNIVVGDVDNASVIYTAHYDTCPRLPFPNFITPKNMFIYILYQLLIVSVILIPVFFVQLLVGFVAAMHFSPDVAFDIAYFAELIAMLLVFSLFLLGPANKHTANDNTSGVTTLIDIMSKLPMEERGKVAFVFFDMEEMGLFGSMGFRSKHKKSTDKKLLINFDCVSDGENALFVVKKGARGFVPLLNEAFPSTEDMNTEIVTKGAIYPSDQASFPCGVGACALKKAKRTGILYMDKIHTSKDTVYREENIEYFSNGAVRLAELISR